MALSVLCDEHIHPAITNGLRLRGIDAIPVQQIGLRSTIDETILDRATALGRVVFTYDRDYLRLNSEGVQHTGIFYSPERKLSIGDTIEAIVAACEVMSAEEMRNHVEYL